MHEIILRFVIGGVFVSVFAVSGEIVRPQSFGGVFGAAPSVALATLVLTIGKDGRVFAALEARSMIGGALAFLIYVCCASRVMMRCQMSALATSTVLIVVWIGCAGTAWLVWLR